MNIGLLAYRQNPHISANTAIAYAVGEELVNKGHNVVFIGRRQDISQLDGADYHGIPISFLNKVPPRSTSLLRNRWERLLGDLHRVKHDSASLKALAKEHRLDALICMTAPDDDALITYGAHLSIPVILYQLDPFYNKNDKEDLRLKRQFLRILPAFKHVFTTELLIKEYQSDPAFSRYVSAFSALPFPKLIRSNDVGKSSLRAEKTTLLYAGSLYHTIRSPKLLERLREILPDTCEIRFCGGCDNDDDLSSLCRSGVLCLGYCAPDVLASEMERADLLINIGNAVKNQMGSKIVDYLATGKPILNISQLKDCPARKFLQDYPYAFQLDADDMVRPSPELLEYVESARGKKMDWETIERSFPTYTPSYAAERILERL